MRIFMLKSGLSPINYIKSALNFPNEGKLAIVGCIDKKVEISKFRLILGRIQIVSNLI